MEKGFNEKIEEEFYKNTQHDVSLIDETVKSQKMDKFQKLIKIANPNLEKDISEYKSDEQLLLSEFTRIFNLKQLLYILSTYGIGVKGEEYIICKIKQKLEDMLTKFSKKYNNAAYLENMSIYDLMGCEIQSNFVDDKDMPLIHQIHKIALVAFQIEKDFQFKDWTFKEKELENNIVINVMMKERYLKYKNNVKKQKKLWDEFEAELINYLENNEKEERKEEDKDFFFSIVKKRNIIPISYTNRVLKNTITFLSFIDKNPNLPVSKSFKELYNSYAEKLDLKSANVNLKAGHIHYFRLINISKLMILVEKYGIEYYYAGIDMLSIISEPLMKVRNENPELLSMEEEYAAQLILTDAAIILGNGEPEVLSNQNYIEILFTTYLDIERAWLTYDVQKLVAMAKKPTDKLILRKRIAESKLVNNFFGYYEEKSKYNEFLNKASGKVLDFPG